MKNNDEVRIGVTGPDTRFPLGWWATRFILWLHGVKAYYITPNSPHAPYALNGIVVGGGDDIEPFHYGEVGDTAKHYDPSRDALEMNVAKKAMLANVPILGICRGAQLINVVCGGSLYGDISKLRKITPKNSSPFAIKLITIKKLSLLRLCLKCTSVKVNQLHNQAIKDLGEGLHISAKDRDGFVQAIESVKLHSGRHFLLGVQWHPEYLFYKKIQRRIFTRLVSAAAKSEATLIL